MFELSLKSWLGQRKPGGLEWPAAKQQIDRGNAVVIFDGIDEAPPAPRELLVKGLGECAPIWMESGNRVVATSRPYAVSESAGRQLNLPNLSIGVLSESMQQLLVSRWFEILADDPENGRAISNGLVADLRDRVWLRPLAENPLLLTSMCIVYGQGRRLPEDKYELYDRIVDTVLHNRFDSGLVPLVRNRLAVVAHGMHVGIGGERRDTPAAQTTVKEIDQILDDYQQTRLWYTEDSFKRVTDARDRLLSDSGLLQPVDDRGASFFHYSFQEFLSAERLADLDRERVVHIFREHGGKPEWRNTLSFLFGAQLANNVSPQRAVELLLGIFDQVVQTTSAVQALLVADCVEVLRGRQVRLEDEPLRRVRDALLAGMREQPSADDRCRLGEALGRIGDHRFRSDRWDLANDELLGFVGVPADPSFFVSRFPVTVGQFRAFVEDRAHNCGFVPRDAMAIRGISNHPVVRIGPDEARAYCQWLLGKLRLSLVGPLLDGSPSPSDWEARLPDDAEWRCAAGAADRRRFPWGSELDPNRFNGKDAGIRATSPVGCFPGGASALGIEDLSGNVWEWTRHIVPAVERLPSGRRGRGHDRWVGRGSSFERGDGSIASALVPDREGPLPTFGFRVVLSRVRLPSS